MGERLREAFRGGSGDKLPHATACAILFLEGYASLSVEVVGLRRLVPWAGSSVPVTAIVLAVYLAALAGGYERGGRIAAEGTRIRERLGQRLAAAAVLSAFWLSGFGPQVVFSGRMPDMLGVVLYSVFGLAPIAWLLAESILLVHKATPMPEESVHAGNIFGVSTAGNVAGALLTALFVLATIGTAGATLIITGALIGGALLASPRRQVAALAVAAGIPLVNAWQEATTYVAKTAYADYRILPVPGENANGLIINRQYASRQSDDDVGIAYAEMIEDALCETPGIDVLVLGAAGQTLGRGRDCRLAIEFVDIDPEQERIAETFLGEKPETVFHAADARVFLLGAGDQQWDAVIADAYSHESSAPGHLLTREFFTLARSRVRSGGALYVNLITYPGDQRFRTRFERTLRSVFADCDVRNPERTEGLWDPPGSRGANFVYRCAKSRFDGDTAVYSDSVPRVSIDRRLR